jgi:catechol 2,3-dioxygenase-like lactoylglutathione lyase family enzyme
MISKLNHVNVFVLDQDRAKQFYTEKLGFEVRNDSVLDGFRWLTVGPRDQPDLGILLAYPAPPMFSPEDAETVRGSSQRDHSAAASSRPRTAGRRSRSCLRRA